MGNDYLQRLADGPLLDADQAFISGGKLKPDPRTALSPEEKERAKTERLMKPVAERTRNADRIEVLFAKYAQIDIPAARVLAHISEATVVDILKDRRIIKRGITDEDREKAIVGYIVDGLKRHGRRIDPAEVRA